MIEIKGCFILSLTFSYAVLIVIITYFKLIGIPLNRSVSGAAKWDVKESWASNLTGVGGILTVLLAIKSIQEAVTGKNENGGPASVEILVPSVFFAALSVTAPFLYNAIGPESRPRAAASDETSNKGQGYVWSFLCACVLTLWAVSGQVATLGTILWQLLHGKSDYTYLLYVFELLLASTFLLIAPYAWKSICGTIADFTQKPHKLKPASKEYTGKGEETEQKILLQLNPTLPPPSWSIL